MSAGIFRPSVTAPGDTPGLVSFHVDWRDGIVSIRDELETQRLRLSVPDLDEVEPAPTDGFLFPVDDAVAVTTEGFSVDSHSAVQVRDERGEHLGGLTSSPREFPRGTYSLEIEGSLKAYVHVVNARFTAGYRSADLDHAPVDVTFAEPTTVRIGARSVHSRPGATVTVPDDPSALLEALPCLASSLKEFSAERSWPTLRGHPPAIERGDALAVPDGLSAPDTGVAIEVPPTYADLYRVAPLAFYLGATLRAGERPRLHLDNGHVEPLATHDRPLADAVEELLGRCLLLDSLTRIGGYYSLPRHEYDRLGPELPFYPPNLADASLSEQLIEYLEVEASVLAPYRPQWPYVATLRPDPADAVLLPGLLHSLVPVRVDESGGTGATDSAGTDSVGTDPARIDPERTDLGDELPTPTPATTADRVPGGGFRLLPGAFANAHDRTIAEPGEARLAVVLADDDRAERFRAYVAEARQSRLRAAAVDVLADPSPDGVERALAADPDLLYYEPAGDGAAVEPALTAACADDACPPLVAVGAPLRPDCEDALVDAGAIAGLTVDAPPTVAELGRLASLLVVGGSLERAAALAGLTPARRLFGKPTHVLVRRADGAIPMEIDVRSLSPDEHEVVHWAPVVETVPIGSVTRLRNERPEDTFHLVGTALAQAAVHSTGDVLDLLADDDHVISLNGEPYHGERDATPALVRESARRALAERRG